MGRIIGKDEFKESMRFAAAEQEADQMIEAEDLTRKKPGPKPGTKRNIAKITKTAPVAAGSKTATRRKTERTSTKVVSKTVEKEDKQVEAIKAALKLMNVFTDFLLKEATERIETADRWADYTEMLGKML